MSWSPRAALVALAAALVVVGAGVLGPAQPASAQLCDPLVELCETTTTTEAPQEESAQTTTTTESTTTTTAPPRTTTTTRAAAQDDDEEEEPEAEEEETTTTSTSTPVLLAEGPPVSATPEAVAGTDGVATTTVATEPVADEGGDEGRTSRQVTLVVTALLVLAVVFGLITYWYWRRTAPPRSRSVASES